MAAKRASPCASSVRIGCALRVTVLPLATPTRRVPKSNPKKEAAATPIGAVGGALMRAPLAFDAADRTERR